jgi:hypothetical protein
MPSHDVGMALDPRTGLLVVRVGHIVTQEDVRTLDDEA